MNLRKRALLSCVPEQEQLPAAVRAAAAGFAGLGHASLLLMWLEAPELTAVQMVPPGSHEIYEKCYPIKRGLAGCVPSPLLYGEAIVSASGKCLTGSLSTSVA